MSLIKWIKKLFNKKCSCEDDFDVHPHNICVCFLCRRVNTKCMTIDEKRICEHCIQKHWHEIGFVIEEKILSEL
jgi:hypothetical protein